MKSAPAFNVSRLIEDHRDLLACLRLTDREPAPARLENLSPGAWQGVFQQSLGQAVTPLLYDRLRWSGALKWVFRPVADSCRQVYLTAMSRNLRLLSRLSDLLAQLNAEKIPVMVLKGAHLAEKVYGDIALRTFDDVDLLFQEKDLPRCRAIFSESVGPGRFRDLPLDIQWNIDLSVADLPIEVGSLWQRSRRTTIGGVETRVLCPEDLLLHLCLHVAFHHRFQSMGLRALCDVRQTVQCFARELDWQALTRRAAAWGAANAVGLTLNLARDLLGADIPADALNRLNPGGVDRRLRQWAVRLMFLPSPADSQLSPYFWGIMQPGDMRRKLSYLRRLILPARPHIIQKYADSIDSKGLDLFYGVRLKANLGRYLKAFLALRKGNEEMTREKNREIEHMDMMDRLAGHYDEKQDEK